MFSPLELPNDSIWKLARSGNYIVHMNLNCSSCLHPGLARLLRKAIGSQSERQVTSAAREGKNIEEKQDIVDSLKSK